MPMEIVRNDITRMSVDAIVNAANSSLKMGGGVCGAIFAAAGEEQMQAACDRIGRCGVGEAVITDGFNLPAKYVIHTAGPIWRVGDPNQAQYLSGCYTHSLELAARHKCTSVAFPLISSGIYGYPGDQALQIAVASIGNYLLHNDMTVYLVVYDMKSFALSGKLFAAIEDYIDDNYVEEHKSYRSRNHNSKEYIQMYDAQESMSKSFCLEPLELSLESSIETSHETSLKPSRSLDDVIAELDETFPEMLMRLIDEKGRTDVETYKRANIDRKLFSKIRSARGYTPSKVTAVAFAVALELNLDETKDLLGRAGFSLSRCSKFDVIIQFFIEKGNYNIFEINQALFAYEQALLGA